MLRAIAALLVAAPLHAGVVYDFVTTVETPRGTTRVSGHMEVEGTSYRADLDGGNGVDVVISHDGDATAMYIDLANCRWWYRARFAETRSSMYFHLAGGPDVVVGEPAVTHRVDDHATIAGVRATKHVIDIRYRAVADLGDSSAAGTILARATIWTADELPPLPMKRDLRTGHPRVDALLARASDEIRGMIVRHELEVTRVFDGGAAQTERTITSVENLRVADLPASLFELPPEAAYVQR